MVEENRHSPAFPTNKKNQILPVKLTTNGPAYIGFFNRLASVQKPNAAFRARNGRVGERDGCVAGVGAVYVRAARRMNGVVKPLWRVRRLVGLFENGWKGTGGLGL